MSVFAVYQPSDLLARELRDQLDRRPELWRELRLLASSDQEFGALAELAGSATFIRGADADGLRGVDILFSCASQAETLALGEHLLPSGTILLIGADTTTVPTIVAGVNDEVATRGTVLATPPAELVHLALILAPLLPLGLERASATCILSASRRGQDALDALLGQTRDILSFKGAGHTEVLGGQLAFNIVRSVELEQPAGAALSAILATPVPIAVQRLEAGLFHGNAVSLNVQFGAGTDLESVVACLEGSPALRLDRERTHLGPIDAAGTDEVLVGLPQRDPSRPGSFWIWSVLDNLTRGGATNALAVAERLVAM